MMLPPGNFVFFLERDSGKRTARRGLAKGLMTTHSQTFHIYYLALRVYTESVAIVMHPIIPTLPEFVEYYDAF